MTMTPIHREYAHRDQSLLLTLIVKRSDARRFRVQIKRNAYDAQSHAIVDTWTPNGWTEVFRQRNILTLKVHAFSYVTKDPAWRTAAEDDAVALLAIANEIVL